jgi:cytochrome c
MTLLPTTGLLCPLSADAQEENGKPLFQQRCATCHTLEAGQNKAGPHLFGIFGRAAYSLGDANYSQAMSSSDIGLDTQSLDTFLAASGKRVLGRTWLSASPMQRGEQQSSAISKANPNINERDRAVSANDACALDIARSSRTNGRIANGKNS